MRPNVGCIERPVALVPNITLQTMTKKIKQLKRVRQCDVLSGQLEQHGVVEELVDGHVLAEALAPSRLHHELASQMGGRLRLERTQHDALVKRIARNDLPVMEHGQTERLALRVRSEIRLETERINRGNEGLVIELIVSHAGDRQHAEMTALP